MFSQGRDGNVQLFGLGQVFWARAGITFALPLMGGIGDEAQARMRVEACRSEGDQLLSWQFGIADPASGRCVGARFHGHSCSFRQSDPLRT